jgi:hypothetical protein
MKATRLDIAADEFSAYRASCSSDIRMKRAMRVEEFTREKVNGASASLKPPHA